MICWDFVGCFSLYGLYIEGEEIDEMFLFIILLVIRYFYGELNEMY